MTQPKYDWIKAVKERPDDAAEVLSYFSDVRASARPCNEAMSKLRAAARVQSVEEANADVVRLVEAAYEQGEPSLRWLGSHLRACREARAREAAEKAGK